MDETWMIFVLPETGLRAGRLAALACSAGLRTKQTCFGVLAEGEAGAVRGFVGALRRDHDGIYVKRRGFSIEDTEICACTFRFEEGLPPWLARNRGQVRRHTS